MLKVVVSCNERIRFTIRLDMRGVIQINIEAT
jgi:hypothetical protein